MMTMKMWSLLITVEVAFLLLFVHIGYLRRIWRRGNLFVLLSLVGDLFRVDTCAYRV